MSLLLIFSIVVLVLFVVFAILLGGPWETPEQLMEQTSALFRKKKSDPAAALRNWAEASLDDKPDLRAWLLSLSEEGFKALTQRLVAYCGDLNLQLSWLVERHVEAMPELHKAVRTVVVDYLEGCREAIRYRDAIALFGKYHTLVTNPADARYHDLRRRLFTRLTAQGLAEPMPSYELIMASETQRQALAAKAIRNVAAKDWDAFVRVFGEVLAGDAEKTEAAAAPGAEE